MFRFRPTHRRRQALYVEPLNYTLDLNRAPLNGHEYIHMQRIQNAADRINRGPREDDILSLVLQFAGNVRPLDKEILMANDFRKTAKALLAHKSELRSKFPFRGLPPFSDEVKFCIFCLGSELGQQIYPSEIHTQNSEAANRPLLSIVLYMEQDDIVSLLKKIYEWYQIIGMNDILGQWMYALLACLERPVSDMCEEVLFEIYTDFSTKSSDAASNKQFMLFCAILMHYFYVHLYKLGPPLERFGKIRS